MSANDGRFEERDGILFRSDESFEPYVSPQTAVERGLLSERKVRHVLQNRVHYALADFLNDSGTNGTDFIRSTLRNFGVQPASNSVPAVIEAYFNRAHGVHLVGSDSVTIEPDLFDAKTYRRNALEREVALLVDRIQDLEPYLAGAYLHGSFGDGEYVRNYSDVDLLVVVDESTVTDAETLVSLRDEIQTLARHYFFVDPHQHHGVMVVAEPTLRAYNRAYLPPAALKRCQSLLDDEPVEFRIRSDKIERHHGFWRVLQTFRKTVVTGQYPSEFDGEYLTDDERGPLYALKHFTSMVQLLPSLFRTAVGRPVYKAESFDLPVFDHGDAELSLVDRCSRVRDQYPEFVDFDRSKTYRKALVQEPAAARRQHQPSEVPNEIWELLGDDYFENALRACEFLWNEIHQN